MVLSVHVCLICLYFERLNFGCESFKKINSTEMVKCVNLLKESMTKGKICNGHGKIHRIVE